MARVVERGERKGPEMPDQRRARGPGRPRPSQTRVFQALHEVAVLVSGVRDPTELARLVVERARDLLDADKAVLHLWDEEHGVLRPLAATAAVSLSTPPIPSGQGVTGQAFSLRRPVLVRDYAQWAYALPWAIACGVQAAAAMPLLVAERAIGVLAVFFDQRGACSPEQAQALSLLAAQVAPALAAARLFEAERRARAQAEASEREARTLYRAALAIGGELDLCARLERVLDAAIELTGAKQTWVVLAVPASNEVEIVATRGQLQHWQGVRQPRGVGLVGTVMRENRPLRVADQQTDPRTWLPERAHRAGFRSWLGVPLADRSGVFGVLAVLSEEADHFTEEDERRLGSLAALAGAAVREAHLYQDAQEAIRARDEFLSIASHELLTPVTGLKGYAQLLQRSLERGMLDPERLTRTLGWINGAADRLAELTRDLLDISRLRTGQLVLRPRPVDLAALVREVADRYGDHPSERHQLVLSVPAACPVQMDPERLDQVLTNLLDNALKYSPAGGQVRVTLRQQGEGALLTVSDEGIGLPPGAETTIFQPFGRASNAAERNLPGMGLGLYICRSIVERHGGQIWAESPGDGQGTTFSVWLPLQASPSPVEPARD